MSFCCLLLLLVLPRRASAGLLTAQGVAVLDQTGAPRSTFSNNETITFQQTINNGAASPNRTQFQFAVVAPDGATVMRHFGNAVPGSIGTAQSQVSGVPISGFYRTPGSYTLKSYATLDGVTVEQDQTFTISSPNILLVYPPNGAQNLTDNPLTFQWYSSGAATYRVTVGDNPSFYNALFIQSAGPGSNSLTYPQNPTDPRERLSAGQIYYWKVEGLNGAGNVIAASQVPFNFSVANVALTRDIAVTGLDITGTPDSTGNIPFLVTVKDQGQTTESNIPLRFTLGGLSAPNSPFTISQISPGDVKTFPASAAIPSDQVQSLAIACLTIFDDNVANNCKTLAVTRAVVSSSTFGGAAAPPLGSDQIWQAIQQLLQQQGVDLSQYNLVNMEGSLTRDELAALLDQLRQGQAQALLSGPALGSVAPPSSITAAPPPSAPGEGFGAPAPPPPPVPDQGYGSAEQEWSGFTAPLAQETVAFAVTDSSKWKRLWSRLTDQPVPDIQFAQAMVLGFIAGRGDRVDRFAIESMSPSGAELSVRYKLVVQDRFNAVDGIKRAAARKEVPYYLKVVPRAALKVRFQQVKENSDE